MGWGAAAMIAYQWYNDRQNRRAAARASQPQPTYLRYAWNPVQRQMYNWMSPYMAGLFGQPGTAPSASAMAARTGTQAFGGGSTTQTQAANTGTSSSVLPPTAAAPYIQERQHGGPVQGQAPYLVGEQGPEMFVPEQQGTVVPLTSQGVGNQQPQTGMPTYGGMPLTPRQMGGPVVPPPDPTATKDPTAPPGTTIGTTGDPTAVTAAPTGNVSAYGGAAGGGAGGGILGAMPTPQQWEVGAAPAPTGNWYGDLDPNVRAGIEQPYQRGMEMLENRLQGRGALGAQRAGISGAGADVLGQYMQKGARSMAQTGWGMMAPGLLQKQRGQQAADYATQQQTWEGQMMPYNMLPQLMPYMMPQGITTTGSPVSFPGSTTAGTTAASGTTPAAGGSTDPNYLAWLQQQQQLQYGPDGGQGSGGGGASPGAGMGAGGLGTAGPGTPGGW